MRSQVTTKRGDAGSTSALSGASYPKSHVIMECVGSVDELRAHTALWRLLVIRDHPQGHEEVSEFLFWLLHVYFLVGTACSDPLKKHPEYWQGEVSPKELERLEREQMRLEAIVKLPPSFIVSASNLLSAQGDITCTVVRRLERNLVRLKEAEPDWDAQHILKFVNRLSDSLYILARFLEGGQHVPVDYGTLA